MIAHELFLFYTQTSFISHPHFIKPYVTSTPSHHYITRMSYISGFGETVSTAEQMAAMNILEHYFEFSDRHHPFVNNNNNHLEILAAAKA